MKSSNRNPGYRRLKTSYMCTRCMFAVHADSAACNFPRRVAKSKKARSFEV